MDGDSPPRFDAAVEYLHERSPDAAEKWNADVAQMMGMIELFPEMGYRHRTESIGDFREIVVGRYRFIYRFAPGVLVMRRVLHVRRDYDPQRIREGVPRGFPTFASG